MSLFSYKRLFQKSEIRQLPALVNYYVSEVDCCQRRIEYPITPNFRGVEFPTL